MIKETKKSPAIRFRGFDGKWIEEKYGKIFSEVKSGLSRSLDIEDIGIPVVRANNISDGNLDLFHDVRYWYDNDPKGADINNYLVEKNDILINFINSESRMGTAAFVDIVPFRKTIYTTNILRVRVNKGYDSKFVFYTTQQEQYKEYIHSITKTAINQASFTTVDLKKYKLSIPKYEEQKHISGLMTCVDNLITLHQRKLDQLKTLKKYFLQNMFPAKGEKVPRIRFKGFTGDWEQRKLKDIANVIDPHPSHRAPAATETGIPFIGIGDVDEAGNINHSTARIVDEKIYDEHHKRYDLSIPSIGISRVASLGKVIRLRNDIGKYAVSPTMSIIQFYPGVDGDYVYSCISSPLFQKQFSSQSNGSTRQSVGIQDLRELIVLIPPIVNEQKEIGTFFWNFDNLIPLHQHKLDQLQTLKKFMLQNLFI